MNPPSPSSPTPPPLPPAVPTPPPLPAEGKPKMVLNLMVAIPTTLLALWLTIADFAYPGNLLFQDSGSLVLTGLYLGLVFLLLLVLAVLPKRIIIAANLLVISRIAMGWPLSLVIDHSLACRIVSLSLLVLSGYYLWSSVRRPLLDLHLRPWLHLRHSALAVLFWIGAGTLAVPVILLGYVEAGKSIIGHYVRFSWKGISLTERVFEKEGRRVHLVGMMHVGDGSFYEDLEKRMRARPTRGTRLVLTEGVADEQNLLPPDFKSGKTYARLAAAFGLQPQNPPADPAQAKVERKKDFNLPGVAFRNADIDVSELPKHHLELLVSMLTFLDTIGSPGSFAMQPEGVRGRDLELLFMDGLLGQRNDVLMQHFTESSPGYAEVYIPWGAAHLPDIETRLLDQGFVQQDEVIRPIIRFWE